MTALSLRYRLLGLILTPLLLLALALGYWRWSAAEATAEALYDRSLTAAALAIARDVAVNQGDLLSPTTMDAVRDVAGGQLFYHVAAPDGAYMTGYAYPPRIEAAAGSGASFGDALYRGEAVRVLRLVERATIGAISGESVVTVWQHRSDRDAFARALALRAAGLMAALLAGVAVVVFFGVRIGLAPLTDLERAIARRTPDDLRPIERATPPEIAAVVQTLNRLFGKVDGAMAAQKAFVSDAAHQLRNPAASVLATALAAQSAKTDDERKKRVDAVVDAARGASRVATQLLSLERLRLDQEGAPLRAVDLVELAREIVGQRAAAAARRGVALDFAAGDAPIMVMADPAPLGEALKNLIDNAEKHGGPTLRRIDVEIGVRAGRATLSVRDDGKGLAPSDQQKAFRRFGQLGPAEGSGLGLAIVDEVAKRHGGALAIDAVASGASLTLRLPLAERAQSTAEGAR